MFWKKNKDKRNLGGIGFKIMKHELLKMIVIEVVRYIALKNIPQIQKFNKWKKFLQKLLWWMYLHKRVQAFQIKFVNHFKVNSCRIFFKKMSKNRFWISFRKYFSNFLRISSANLFRNYSERFFLQSSRKPYRKFFRIFRKFSSMVSRLLFRNALFAISRSGNFP